MTLKFDRWPCKTIGHLFDATSSFVHHFVAICVFKLELQSATSNLGQIRRFLEPWDFEIWWMTLKNNRAPLLCCFQLCAWVHYHMWIQTGVRVRKRLSWVLTSVTLTFDLWPWPFAWTSLLTMVITPENFMMIRWCEHGSKGVTNWQTDRRTDGLNQSYSCLVAAKNLQMIDLKFAFWSIIDHSGFDQSDQSFSRIVWPLLERWCIYWNTSLWNHCPSPGLQQPCEYSGSLW